MPRPMVDCLKQNHALAVMDVSGNDLLVPHLRALEGRINENRERLSAERRAERRERTNMFAEEFLSRRRLEGAKFVDGGSFQRTAFFLPCWQGLELTNPTTKRERRPVDNHAVIESLPTFLALLKQYMMQVEARRLETEALEERRLNRMRDRLQKYAEDTEHLRRETRGFQTRGRMGTKRRRIAS